MTHTSRSIVPSLFFVLGLALLEPRHARADLLAWDLLADCPAGKQEVTLKMTYTVANYWMTDPVKASETLWGCGGACPGPSVIATKVNWKTTGTSCYCMKSGTTVSDLNQCPQNDYGKCSRTVEATLPYACDALGHAKICNREACEAKDSIMYGPDGVCAALKPSASATQCFTRVEQADRLTMDPPTGQVVEMDELGGCSVGAANTSLMTLLLLVAGLSLLLSRKRRRCP